MMHLLPTPTAVLTFDLPDQQQWCEYCSHVFIHHCWLCECDLTSGFFSCHCEYFFRQFVYFLNDCAHVFGVLERNNPVSFSFAAYIRKCSKNVLKLHPYSGWKKWTESFWSPVVAIVYIWQPVNRSFDWKDNIRMYKRRLEIIISCLQCLPK